MYLAKDAGIMSRTDEAMVPVNFERIVLAWHLAQGVAGNRESGR